MGHTTRCIPIIAHLTSAGHTITFAGNEWQRQYIQSTFPTINTIHLDGYNVRYSNTAGGFMPSILSQLPRLLRTIRDEHQWLLSYAANNHIDGIISDNRYGIYHPSIPSVIITHQLQPLTGLGNSMDNLLRKFHYRLLNKFPSKWIVDISGSMNLAGKLSHPNDLPPNTSYIGLLSQMEATDSSEENHLLVLLSGPEPQRTLLSKILWKQVQHYSKKVVFIEGSDDVAVPSNIPNNILYHTRIAKQVLQPLIANASVVICRSGYSSIMDLVATNKRAILIPTPGQTEQEYLARHLHKEGFFYSAVQKDFNIESALRDIHKFPSKIMPLKNAFRLHKEIINRWIEEL